VVPGGGIEPPRAEARRILSPLRLPVPPSRLAVILPDASRLNPTVNSLGTRTSGRRTVRFVGE
jgi:hypothetical protein